MARNIRLVRNTRAATIVAATSLVLVSACALPEESIDEPPAATSQVEEVSESTSTTIQTTTTTEPPKLNLEDLPLASQDSTDRDAVRVAQALADQAGFATAVDGLWGNQTQTNVDALRAEYGLPSGGLDADLWFEVLSRPNRGIFEAKRALEGLQIPEPAIYLDDDVAAYDPSALERYVLPFRADPDAIAQWVRSNNPQAALGSWRWCEALTIDSTGIQPLAMFWWQASGRELSIAVRDKGAGRVELHLAVEEGTDPTGCEGADGSSSSSNSSSSSSGSSGSSSSGSSGTAGCFVGMNVEQCEDLLGLASGERFPYIDCSGRSRSIFWANNWWIIGAQNGTAIVSKSPYGCE